MNITHYHRRTSLKIKLIAYYIVIEVIIHCSDFKFIAIKVNGFLKVIGQFIKFVNFVETGSLYFEDSKSTAYFIGTIVIVI